jgi:hypothetical protein
MRTSHALRLGRRPVHGRGLRGWLVLAALPLLAASGCKCGGGQPRGGVGQDAAAAPAVAASQPASAPASRPSCGPVSGLDCVPSSLPRARPASAPALPVGQAARARAEFQQQVEAAIRGKGDLAALRRAIVAYHQSIIAEDDAPSWPLERLQLLATKPLELVAECEAMREKSAAPCKRLAALEGPSMRVCENVVGAASLARETFAQGKCPPEVLAEKAREMGSSEAAMLQFCTAVSSRNPAKCDALPAKQRAVCAALATGDVSRCAGVPADQRSEGPGKPDDCRELVLFIQTAVSGDAARATKKGEGLGLAAVAASATACQELALSRFRAGFARAPSPLRKVPRATK